MNLREWALPVYTILIQMSVGMLLVLWILRTYYSRKVDRALVERIVRDPLLVIITTIFLGMVGAHFHLSRPFLSFLAIRNFGTSWLSREIVFTLLFFLSTLALFSSEWFKKGSSVLNTILGWVAVTLGIVTVYCMGRIYLLPTQAAWDAPTTIPSFYGSMLLLGVMAQAVVLIMDLRFMQVRNDDAMVEWVFIVNDAIRRLAVAAEIIFFPVLFINLFHLYLMRTGPPLAQTSYELLIDVYFPLLIVRFLLLGGVGYLSIPVARMRSSGKNAGDLFTPIYFACLLVIVAEVLGRFLFYASHIRVGL